MTAKTAVLAWHFTDGEKLRDGTALECRTYTHDGPLVVCYSGLHASRRALHALKYARGSHVSRVECSGEMQEHDDKLVCRVRRVLWHAEAEDTLRAFACWCALWVADLWDAPAIVYEYLETGDEAKRDAARAAARAATRAAARAAAWDAARIAACYAARDAARVAARPTAWDAARDTASAARAAARAAAWDAARAAARAATRAAARAAARAVQEEELTRRLLALVPEDAR